MSRAIDRSQLKKLVCWVDPKLHRHLKKFAFHNDRSMQSVINAAIARYTSYGEVNLVLQAFPRPLPPLQPDTIVGYPEVTQL
jgi:hypothetical protein